MNEPKVAYRSKVLLIFAANLFRHYLGLFYCIALYFLARAEGREMRRKRMEERKGGFVVGSHVGTGRER